MAVYTTAPPALIHTAILDGISVLDTELGMYITCRLVSDVWRGARRATRAGNDFAGPSVNMDFCKARADAHCELEAGLGGADVAVHSCQIEKQPAT